MKKYRWNKQKFFDNIIFPILLFMVVAACCVCPEGWAF